MTRAIVLVVLVGCYRPSDARECAIACTTACPSGLECGTDQMCHAIGKPQCDQQPAIDAPIVTDVPPQPLKCFGQPSMAPICFGGSFPPLPTVDLTIDNVTTFDTSIANGCFVQDPDGTTGEVCVLAARTITVGGTGRIVGTGHRPLVLLALQTLEVRGAVDVSSVPGRIGAGAKDAGCAPTPPGDPSTSVPQGGGGGAGGTFGGRGGVGGRGGNGGGNGGIASAITMWTHLRGGCPGGAGGTNPGGLAGGEPGAGGGAVYLISGGQLVVSGRIIADGQGGGGGVNQGTGRGGGAGGGSGGMIALEALMLIFNNGNASANGGGGGGGSSLDTDGGAGGEPPMFLSPAAGGKAPDGATPGVGDGDGGIGSTGLMGGPGRIPIDTDNGGGGGGGGTGGIRMHGPLSGTNGGFSPGQMPF